MKERVWIAMMGFIGNAILSMRFIAGIIFAFIVGTFVSNIISNRIAIVVCGAVAGIVLIIALRRT